jgi:nicotinate dehydrogenase subunit B
LLPYDQTHDAVWNRGAYLAASLGHCGACHSPHNALGAERVDRAYQGGEAEGWDGPALSAGTSPAPLSWSAAQVTAFLRTGLADHHAAAAGPMMPVSHDLSAVDLADVQAIATYIASLAGPDDPARDKSVAEFVAAAQASDDPKLSQTAGAVVFAGACAGCHGAGAPMMLNGRPSLALGSALAAAEPRNAIQVILHGLQPRDGEAGPWMPGFAAGLTDTQVADVLAYLRARFTDRAAWNMQTLPATIAGIRKQPAS